MIAVPFYFGAMAAERARQRRRAAASGPTAGDYERHDTRASLTMGTLSLLAPLVVPRLLRPVTPGRGRYAKVLVAAAAAAVVVTTAADVVVRRSRRADNPPGRPAGASRNGSGPRVEVPVDPRSAAAARVAAFGGVAAVALGGVAVTTAWASHTSVDRLWRRRILPDLGRGPLALALAVVGWDFIYYWNHRYMH